MGFAPIRADRCFLWITLLPDETVNARYDALHAVLKECRLHPADTTGSAQLVIVEAAAFKENQARVRATLGPGDTIHMITRAGDRLQARLVASPALVQEGYPRPPERRPPWLQDRPV